MPTPLRTLASLLALLAAAPLLARAARAGPILSEVLYDGDGADADDAFTEIFGAPGTSLDGWSLVGINGADGSAYRTVDLTGATIPLDGILVVATSSAAGAVLLARDWIGNVDWQNGPDAVWLVDPFGLVADALQYGDAGIHNAGEGSPALDVAAGWSLARDFLGTDTDDNALDFLGIPSPTPGFGPLSPAPEPATFALVALGGAGLCVGRRRRRWRTGAVAAAASCHEGGAESTDPSGLGA